MREYLDAASFRDIIFAANAALEKNKQIINELNVFPVPDGDTGTNMSLTMSAAAAELRKKETDTIAAAADVAASALLRGARGNSGVILSLLFRGLAKRLKGHDTADAKLFAAAMSDGVDAAYKAVMKPAEGTILTVSRVATSAALEFAEGGSDMELMMSCAVESAREALADTINLNPVLKRAGVVDAGGKGYLFILESALAIMRGETPDLTLPAETAAAPTEHADFGAFDTGEITFAYDTVYIVRKAGEVDLDPLREYLNSIGDSLVISEDDEMFKVHVHTNIPGDALTQSQKYGELEIAKIENMRTQHDELSAGKTVTTADDCETERDDTPAVPEKKYGVVAVCAGDGMAELFRELGADRIVTGGQTMNPSTDDILRAINHTPAETVFVYPNNKNIIMAADQCVPLTSKEVVVIPTKTVPQGVSALLALDTGEEEADMMDAMTEAIEGTHTALVTYAARDSEFDGHAIHSGEYLALLDGKLIGSYTSLKTLLEELSWAFDDLSPALISVYYGEDVEEADANAAAELLGGCFPDAEVSVVRGGQPVYYYMIGVE